MSVDASSWKIRNELGTSSLPQFEKNNKLKDLKEIKITGSKNIIIH